VTIEEFDAVVAEFVADIESEPYPEMPELEALLGGAR
jgi:hypothetical protein